MKQSQYFSHDFYARRDPKLLKLQIGMGLKGLGLFWCVIEFLHEQDGILKESDLDLICFEMKVKKKYLLELLENYELFSKVDENFISFSVNRRISIKKEKSFKAKNSSNRRWSLQPHKNENANAMRTHSERNAINKEINKEIKELHHKDHLSQIDIDAELFSNSEDDQPF